MIKKISFLVFIVSLIIGGIYASLFYSPPSQEAQREKTPIPKNASRKVFKLQGGNYYYSLKEIKVKKGEVVRIELVVVGGTHDWVVDEFDARTELVSAGQKTIVEFVADKAGKFVYYCSMPNHRQLGQAGMLIVEE